MYGPITEDGVGVGIVGSNPWAKCKGTMPKPDGSCCPNAQSWDGEACVAVGLLSCATQSGAALGAGCLPLVCAGVGGPDAAGCGDGGVADGSVACRVDAAACADATTGCPPGRYGPQCSVVAGSQLVSRLAAAAAAVDDPPPPAESDAACAPVAAVAAPPAPTVPTWCPDAGQGQACLESPVVAFACPAGFVTAGKDDCAPDPALCASAPYGGELPADALYVSAEAAPGGDGSAAAPLGSLTAALAVAKVDQTIAVDSGTYQGPFGSKVAVQIRGRCAAEVLLTSTDSNKPVWSWSSGTLGLHNVRISGEERGLVATGGAVTLERVAIDGARTIGLHATNGATVTGTGLVIRSTNASLDGKNGRGAWAESGANMTLANAVVVGNRTAGLTFAGATTQGKLTKVTVVGTLSQTADNKGGRGIVVSDGAGLVAEGLQVHHNRAGGIALYNAGKVVLTAAAVTGTRSEPDSGVEGYGVLVSGGTLTGQALLIADNQSAGLYVSGPASSVELNQVYVRATQPNASGLGVGVRVESGAEVTLTALDSSQNTAYGVLVSGAETSLHVEDGLVANTAPDPTDSGGGYGVWCQDGASCSLTATRVDQNRTAGVTAAGKGSALELESCVVSATQSRASDLGRGVGVQVVEGASISATGLVIYGNRATGLWVSDPGPVVLDGLQIAETMAQENDGWGGRGIHWVRSSASQATGTIRNGILRNNRDHQIYLDADSVDLENVALANTAADANGDAGHALQVRNGARLTGSQVVLTDHRAVAVLARDPATSVTLYDGCILRTEPRAADGAYGRAAVAESGAALTLGRIRLGGHRGVTVSAASVPGASLADTSALTLEDVVIDGSLAGTSAGDLTARGVEVHHSLLAVRGLRVHDAAGAALAIYGDANADAPIAVRDLHVTHSVLPDTSAAPSAVGLVADDAGELVVRRLRSTGPLAVHLEVRGKTQFFGGHVGLHHKGPAATGVGLYCVEQASCTLAVSQLTGAWQAGLLAADPGTNLKLVGTAIGAADAAARAQVGALVVAGAVLQATASAWLGADSAAVAVDAAGASLASCAVYQSAAKQPGADGLRLTAGASAQFSDGQIADFGRCGALAGANTSLSLTRATLGNNRFGIGQMPGGVYNVVASWLTGNQVQLGVGAFVLPTMPDRPPVTERAPAFTL